MLFHLACFDRCVGISGIGKNLYTGYHRLEVFQPALITCSNVYKKEKHIANG